MTKKAKIFLGLVYGTMGMWAITLVFLQVITSCGPSKEELEAAAKAASDSAYRAGGGTEYVDPGFPTGCSVVKIDSCEYVTFATYYGASIIHKANCKNH